jgi:hypothetical protein
MMIEDDSKIEVYKSINCLRSLRTVARNVVVENGVVGCRTLSWRWFSPHTYFSAVSLRIYQY